MRKISGQVLSTKHVSLSRAAKLISRFAAVDNGSTPAISLYLERAAESFNHLVQFHKKRDVGDEPDRDRVQRLQSNWLETDKKPDGEKGASAGDEDTNNAAIRAAAVTNPKMVDETRALSNAGEEKSKEKKKEKKKRKSEPVDSGEKKGSKRRKSDS